MYDDGKSSVGEMMKKRNCCICLKWFMVNPYCTILAVLSLFAMLLGVIIMLCIMIEENRNASLLEALCTGSGFGFLFVLTLTAVLIAVYLFNSFEYFGKMEIHPDGLQFCALFHKPRKFYYEDLVEVGIDYGLISGTTQFWLIFSKEKIPGKYRHRANRIPFSKDTMRIAYSKKVYDTLCFHVTNKKVLKQLQQVQTVIRLHNLE